MNKIWIACLAILCTGCNTQINPNKEPIATVANSQKEINLLLTEKIKNADSVLLISHTGASFDSTKHFIIMPEILTGEKVNRQIIKEYTLLPQRMADSLNIIVSLPTNNNNIEGTHCFDPHHTIFIFNHNKISYIDMCFHCYGLRTSADLHAIIGYEAAKWKRLLLFFREAGFKYEMPDE